MPQVPRFWELVCRSRLLRESKPCRFTAPRRTAIPAGELEERISQEKGHLSGRTRENYYAPLCSKMPDQLLSTPDLPSKASAPGLAAMPRIDRPASIPREISSRSTGPRWRATGAIPPLNAKTWWIAPLVHSRERPISLAQWPLFHRSQSSVFFSGTTPDVPFSPCAPPHRQIRSEGVASIG
jgi:hypothetical protein